MATDLAEGLTPERMRGFSQALLHLRQEPRDLARRFVKPWRLRATGHDYQAALSWDHVKRFKDRHAVPLILKGIATAEELGLAAGPDPGDQKTDPPDDRPVRHAALHRQPGPRYSAPCSGRPRPSIRGYGERVWIMNPGTPLKL
jgi:hypothetical protein